MPDWRQAIREHMEATNLDPAREAEIVEELSAHLDDRYGELMAGGAGETRARRIAIAELKQLRIVARRAAQEPLPIGSKGGRNLMANFLHDLRVALRTIRNRPGYSFAVIFLLAVGWGGDAV